MEESASWRKGASSVAEGSSRSTLKARWLSSIWFFRRRFAPDPRRVRPRPFFRIWFSKMEFPEEPDLKISPSTFPDRRFPATTFPFEPSSQIPATALSSIRFFKILFAVESFSLIPTLQPRAEFSATVLLPEARRRIATLVAPVTTFSRISLSSDLSTAIPLSGEEISFPLTLVLGESVMRTPVLAVMRESETAHPLQLAITTPVPPEMVQLEMAGPRPSTPETELTCKSRTVPPERRTPTEQPSIAEPTTELSESDERMPVEKFRIMQPRMVASLDLSSTPTPVPVPLISKPEMLVPGASTLKPPSRVVSPAEPLRARGRRRGITPSR